jgi:hypothetical protein
MNEHVRFGPGQIVDMFMFMLLVVWNLKQPTELLLLQIKQIVVH